MANSSDEENTALVSRSPIDINGGHTIFGVFCALCEFLKISDKTSAIVQKNIVLNRLHHKEPAELLIGLENVPQITQVRTQP